MIPQIEPAVEIIYPETDGEPMGENTLQVKWIMAIYNGLEVVFRDRDVFIAADLFWYPVEGDARCVLAPDILVAFGRPKGDRPSYKQWEEDGVAPQVVFEILSPSNRPRELAAKFDFYEGHGVQEYYEYDPEAMKLNAWVRRGTKLSFVKERDGFVSPLLGVRFEVPGTEPMRLIGPDGSPFRNYLELVDDALELQERVAAERRRADKERLRAEAERDRAEAESRQAEAERLRAETAIRQAETERDRAETAIRQAETERDRAETLAALLREHGIDPDTAIP